MMMSIQGPYILCHNLYKVFHLANHAVEALRGVNLEASQREMVALLGSTSSGKSTLLNIISSIVEPSSGALHVAGHNLFNIGGKLRTTYKNHIIGYAPQHPIRNLDTSITILENIERAMGKDTRVPSINRRSKSLKILHELGLEKRRSFKPDQLSCGEQGKLSLGVALANNPPLLLADEPTGLTDRLEALKIYQFLHHINQTSDTTIMIVTHDPEIVPYVNQIAVIQNGRIRGKFARSSRLSEPHKWHINASTEPIGLPPAFTNKMVFSTQSKHMMKRIQQSQQRFHLLDHDRLQTDMEVMKESLLWDLPKYHGAEIRIRGLKRVFQTPIGELHALNDINVHMPPGQLIVLSGPSGSGKSTLLRLISGFDIPSDGNIFVDDMDLASIHPKTLQKFHRYILGYVSQSSNLMSFMTVQESIEAPLRMLKRDKSERMERTEMILRLLQVENRRHCQTDTLSASERKLIAVGRALASFPRLLVIDEPTGQMNTDAAEDMVYLLRHIADQLGTTIIVASHDPRLQQKADRIIQMGDKICL